MATKVNADGSVSLRTSHYDISSATTFLRQKGYEVRASDDPRERSKYVLEWPAPSGRREKMSSRELWFLVRGMRIGWREAKGFVETTSFPALEGR